MGEIADMMIGGDMCPCGEYLGGGFGAPQYCSSQCARDFGDLVSGSLPEAKSNQCPTCGKGFRHEHGLKQHIIAKHTEFSCPYCSKVCKTVQGVNDHVAAKHPEIGHFNRLDEVPA